MVGRQLEPGDRRRVADAAVGDDRRPRRARSARRARMSPIVPAPLLVAGLDHQHLARARSPRSPASGRSARACRRRRRPRAPARSAACARSRPCAGRAVSGCRPARKVLADPALAGAASSASRSRPAGAAARVASETSRPRGRRARAERVGADRGRHLRHRAEGLERQRVPRRSRCGPSRRPSTSTSTTSPGSHGRELAGVPVRITSPGSRVMKRERSATSRLEGEDQRRWSTPPGRSRR